MNSPTLFKIDPLIPLGKQSAIGHPGPLIAEPSREKDRRLEPLTGTPDWVIDPRGSGTTASINHIKFKEFETDGVASGHSLDGHVYRNFHRNTCYELSIRTAATNPRMFDGPVKEFTQKNWNEVNGQVKQSLDTFRSSHSFLVLRFRKLKDLPDFTGCHFSQPALKYFAGGDVVVEQRCNQIPIPRGPPHSGLGTDRWTQHSRAGSSNLLRSALRVLIPEQPPPQQNPASSDWRCCASRRRRALRDPHSSSSACHCRYPPYLPTSKDTLRSADPPRSAHKLTFRDPAPSRRRSS